MKRKIKHLIGNLLAFLLLAFLYLFFYVLFSGKIGEIILFVINGVLTIFLVFLYIYLIIL